MTRGLSCLLAGRTSRLASPRAHLRDGQTPSFAKSRIFSAPYHAAAIKIRTAVAAVDTTAGIIRVDPNPWLCDTTGAYQICPPVILGTLVYHDPWHLSTTFVGRLATLLNAAIPKV